MAENAPGFTGGIYLFWRRYKSGGGGEKEKKVMIGAVERREVYCK